MKPLILSACLLTLANTTFAACDRPEAPTLPDGKSASKEQMIEGQQAVKAFMGSNEAYLECLTKVAQDAVETDSEEQKQARLAEYNASVEAMQTVASGFNQAIKDYKQANAK